MITSGELPGVSFFSVDAIRENVAEAIAIEAIRTEFEQTGDEIKFWHDLASFGFEPNEIEAAIANPAARPAIGYA